jgi:putative transposase
MNVNSLAHTKWECKYHIVFAAKYRRQVIYKDIKADVGQILGSLCRRKGIEIIEAECCPDHIHMLVRIPPKYSVSEIVGYLKGKSSLIDIGFACAYGNNGKFHRIERRTL